MNIVARWSIVAGVLGMLVVGGACGGSNSPNPQGLGGSGDPEVDAGVVDNDDAGNDPKQESPSIVDSGIAEDSGSNPTGETDAGNPGENPGDDAGPQLSACAACVAESCPEERDTCLEDETCVCWADCAESGGLSECIKDCNAPNQTTLAYHQCRDRNCLSECSPQFDPGVPDGGLLPDGGLFPDGGFADFDAGLPGLDAGVPGMDGGDTRSCEECLAQDCSSANAACEGNANCACWAGCFNGNNWVECTQECGTGSQAWFNLLGCRTTSCPQCR